LCNKRVKKTNTGRNPDRERQVSYVIGGVCIGFQLSIEVTAFVRYNQIEARRILRLIRGNLWQLSTSH
jgi:hypothetical protein